MAEPMDVDIETPRGTKRKAVDEIITAPRRIKVSSLLLQYQLYAKVVPGS